MHRLIHKRLSAGAFCIGRPGALWRRCLLATCLALLLAGGGLPLATLIPVAAAWPVSEQDPVAAAKQRGIAWLHTQQLPDGSFGQRLAGQPTGSPSTTADAVYVLALLGEDPGGPGWSVNGHSALDALAALAPDFARADAGQAGKVALAVAAAGRDPHSFGGLDLVGIIEGFYDPATGRYHPQLLFRDAIAVQALARSGVQVPNAALDALWQARLPDGGWFWAFDGQESDLDTTGFVTQVLATYAPARCAPALLPAVDYLAGHQDPAGGWGATNPPGPPNANSTALAVAGLIVMSYDVQNDTGVLARHGQSPLASLLAFQEPGGAFVYIRQPGREEVRLAATSDALSALSLLVPGKPSGPACNLMYLPLRLAR
jgi:hypothetical protein